MQFLMTSILLLLPVLAQAEGVGDRQTASTAAIKGDVLYWEGDELIVKEMSGREARMHVNGSTKIEGAAGKLKTGDKIEAVVTPEGIAQSIRLHIPDGSAGSTPPSR